MASEIINNARSLTARILGSGGFSVAIDLEANDGTPLTVNALAPKHFFSVDLEGTAVNSEQARITVSENDLKDANYPYVSTAGRVRMRGHKVTFTDSAGYSKKYVVNEAFPNRTIGLIVLILGAYNG